MSFGIMNAPVTWHRLIDRLLAVYLEEDLMAYSDDNIAIFKILQEHLRLLTTVIDRLKALV